MFSSSWCLGLSNISSIFFIQSSNIQDETALQALREAQNRVQYMALIHENFYKS
ncbi:MAG: hypothetical protein K1X26_07070, partial [Chitinophagales bacterium]|nr:hypothetical protein [Chitinophagales bacterium]